MISVHMCMQISHFIAWWYKGWMPGFPSSTDRLGSVLVKVIRGWVLCKAWTTGNDRRLKRHKQKGWFLFPPVYLIKGMWADRAIIGCSDKNLQGEWLPLSVPRQLWGGRESNGPLHAQRLLDGFETIYLWISNHLQNPDLCFTLTTGCPEGVALTAPLLPSVS